MPPISIASTCCRAKNMLSTASLTFSDIANTANYKTSQIGLGESYNSSAGPNGGSHFMPVLSPSQSDSRRSTTKAGIAQGTIVTSDGATDLAGLDRQPTLDNQALKKFDLNEVQNDQAFVAGLSGFASQVIDDVYSAKLAKQQAQIDAVQARADEANARGDAVQASQLYEQISQMRDERDSGHGQALAKGISSVAISALGGHVNLSSGLAYYALSGGIGYAQEEAGKAMRGHDETVTMKVACINPAQDCADLRIPEDLTGNQRIQYLRDHGMSVTFLDQIPEGARNITVNGILNDEARAAHVEAGHVSQGKPEIKDTTYYVQYNASKGGLSDLLQSGYDKFISPLNGDYSATILAGTDAVWRQGENAQVSLYAHSWGSIVTRNILNLLADDGYTNPNLTTAVFGAAVRPGALVGPMVKIAGKDKVFPAWEPGTPKPASALIYMTRPNDPVSTFVGGTLFPPYNYLNSNSPQHLPGAAAGQVWSALRGIGPLMSGGGINPHSCYGLNCAGTEYNWTIEKAEQWMRKPAGGRQ